MGNVFLIPFGALQLIDHSLWHNQLLVLSANQPWGELYFNPCFKLITPVFAANQLKAGGPFITWHTGAYSGSGVCVHACMCMTSCACIVISVQGHDLHLQPYSSCVYMPSFFYVALLVQAWKRQSALLSGFCLDANLLGLLNGHGLLTQAKCSTINARIVGHNDQAAGTYFVNSVICFSGHQKSLRTMCILSLKCLKATSPQEAKVLPKSCVNCSRTCGPEVHCWSCSHYTQLTPVLFYAVVCCCAPSVK